MFGGQQSSDSCPLDCPPPEITCFDSIKTHGEVALMQCLYIDLRQGGRGDEGFQPSALGLKPNKHFRIYRLFNQVTIVVGNRWLTATAIGRERGIGTANHLYKRLLRLITDIDEMAIHKRLMPAIWSAMNLAASFVQTKPRSEDR